MPDSAHRVAKALPASGSVELWTRNVDSLAIWVDHRFLWPGVAPTTIRSLEAVGYCRWSAGDSSRMSESTSARLPRKRCPPC